MTSVARVPVQKPGKSRQDYGSPWPFIKAVEKRFGHIVCDLAASDGNSKANKTRGPGHHYTEQQDSLRQRWAAAYPTGLLYCNPPFADIGPWAKKCVEESTMRHGLIALLTPASIGTEWFAEHVDGKAFVLGLRPRLTFEGETTPYPKDLALTLFGFSFHGFATWRWQ